MSITYRVSYSFLSHTPTVQDHIQSGAIVYGTKNWRFGGLSNLESFFVLGMLLKIGQVKYDEVPGLWFSFESLHLHFPGLEQG